MQLKLGENLGKIIRCKQNLVQLEFLLLKKKSLAFAHVSAFYCYIVVFFYFGYM